MKGFTSKWMKESGIHAKPNGEAKKLEPDKPQKKLTENDIQRAIQKASSKREKKERQIDPKAFIEYAIQSTGFKYETEFKFASDRKFRADWAIPSKNLLVEFEGIMSEKSRHTSIVGFSKDTEKYSCAALLGYKVLRYTVLNYKRITEDLKRI